MKLQGNHKDIHKDTVIQLICNTDSSYDPLIIQQYFVIENCILIKYIHTVIHVVLLVTLHVRMEI